MVNPYIRTHRQNCEISKPPHKTLLTSQTEKDSTRNLVALILLQQAFLETVSSKNVLNEPTCHVRVQNRGRNIFVPVQNDCGKLNSLLLTAVQPALDIL